MLANECDVVVIGAGAAGMTAALTAAAEGLSVVIIEHATQVGGTSALAAGTLWIPGNHFMATDEAALDRRQASDYLNEIVGHATPAAIREAYLEHGPAMLDYLRENTSIRFRPCPRHADYHPEIAGARPGGRPVEPVIFDGRELGEAFDLLRPPIAEFMLFGGMMASKSDIDLLLQAGRRFAGTSHAIGLVIRYLRDRIVYKRGTRLTMGNALCAALLHECLQRQVALAIRTKVISIEAIGQLGHRLKMSSNGDSRTLTAGRGIIFAGGGFSGNESARREHMPKPTPEFTAAFEGADGSSQALARMLGAQLGPSCEHNAWWFPSSVVPRGDGSQGVFPHIIMDRAKPGLIAVDRDGQRFTNEGVSYHQFARAQYAAGAIPCWLVCDAAFVRRYGLGAVRPGGFGLRRAIDSGYLTTASSLPALAALIKVNPAGLVRSAERMTQFAASGEDEDFAKGSDSLSRQNGDADYRGPNPCLGPVATGPFYAVAVAPADLGTSRGLLTDTNARLLDDRGNPIPGLYACGNDMQSIMGGQYPAPGVTLGPAMTFGYLAALDCAHDAPAQ